MASVRPGSSESILPSVLGPDGTIDLTGGLVREDSLERPTGRPSGDAWLVDRDRRSLPPPAMGAEPVAAQETEEPSPDDSHREIADHFALGDYAAAEQRFLQAYAKLQPYSKTADAIRLRVATLLTENYTKMGRPKDAAQWQSKVDAAPRSNEENETE